MTTRQPTKNPKRVLTFTEHLDELRVRLIICIVFFVVTFFAGFFVAHHVLGWLIAPLTHVGDPGHAATLTFKLTPEGTLRVAPSLLADLVSTAPEARKRMAAISPQRIAIEIPGGDSVIVGQKSRTSLHFLSPLEPFFLLLKGGLLISCVFSVPLAIYQLWLFTAPGLKRRERRVVKPILLSSFVLFPLGAAFAYLIAHLALKVLLSFSDQIPGLQPNIVASEYLGFLMTLMLAFGIVFEFPLVLVLLSRIGIVNSAMLVKYRRMAILVIAVAAAIFTPPDPFSMIVTILPMVLLFEASIWAIRVFERGDVPERRQLPEKTV